MNLDVVFVYLIMAVMAFILLVFIKEIKKGEKK
jgi:hypothetical protein